MFVILAHVTFLYHYDTILCSSRPVFVPAIFGEVQMSSLSCSNGTSMYHPALIHGASRKIMMTSALHRKLLSLFRKRRLRASLNECWVDISS